MSHHEPNRAVRGRTAGMIPGVDFGLEIAPVECYTRVAVGVLEPAETLAFCVPACAHERRAVRPLILRCIEHPGAAP